ncbi:hypothetical protein PMAYCL1PPCAC_08844, partial [Pristionchus mayeri]
SNPVAVSKPIDVQKLVQAEAQLLNQTLSQVEHTLTKDIEMTNATSSTSCPVPRPIDDWPPEYQSSPRNIVEKPSIRMQTEIPETEGHDDKEDLKRGIREYEQELADALKTIFGKEDTATKMKERIRELEKILIEV